MDLSQSRVILWTLLLFSLGSFSTPLASNISVYENGESLQFLAPIASKEYFSFTEKFGPLEAIENLEEDIQNYANLLDGLTKFSYDNIYCSQLQGGNIRSLTISWN